MLDIFKEELLTFAEAVRRLPRFRNDRPLATATLRRWAACGLGGVRLEAIKVGGSNCTSEQALERFIARLNGTSVPPKLSKDDRDDEVDRELAALGV